MDYELKNARFVQPFVDVTNLTVIVNSQNVNRGAIVQQADYPEPVTEIPLNQSYLIKEWVEVYVDGFRLVNATYDFGETHEDFEITPQSIIFNTPQVGNIKIIMDYQATGAFLPEQNTIKVRNRQGARTKATQPGDLYAAYFCTPLILTEPLNGFVRVSDDGLNLVYCPDPDYEGFDAFSYTVITERGQIAEPKCVYVKVGNPTIRNP